MENSSNESVTHINQELDSIEHIKKSSVWIYFGIQAFINFAQNLRFQYLPIYARKLGATQTQMGLLTSVQNVFSTFMGPFWGRQSDKFGRKQFMMLGATIASMTAVVMAFANTAEEIIVLVAINGIALSMLLPAWSGAIADYTDEKNRGGFMGRLLGVGYYYVTLALLTYALIAPYIPVSELSQFRIIMLISAGNFILVILFSWLLLDLNGKEKQTISQESKISVFEPLKDPAFRRFLYIVLTWWFFMSVAWSYFPQVVNDVTQATAAQIAYLGIIAAIFQAVSSYKYGDFIDRWGDRKALIVGFLPFSIVPLTFAIATKWWHLIPAQIISGIAIGAGFAALETYILNIAGDEKKAGAYKGTYLFSWGLVTFVGSLLGGIFLDWFVDEVGSLADALVYSLIGLTVLRAFTNILMVLFLPATKKY